MVPTADQIAHAIVEASRFYKVDPVLVIRQTLAKGRTERSRALIYALIAIADTFGNDQMASRLVGLTSTRAGTTRWQISKGALRWWDPKVLEQVKAAIPDAPIAPPVRRPVSPAPTPAQNFGTIGGMGPPRPYSPARDLVGEKASLRNQLAEAVRNTAKMPSQN